MHPRQKKEGNLAKKLWHQHMCTFALSDQPKAHEIVFLDTFAQSLSAASRQLLMAEPYHVPFTNLERKKGESKRHGIGRPHVPRESRKKKTA